MFLYSLYIRFELTLNKTKGIVILSRKVTVELYTLEVAHTMVQMQYSEKGSNAFSRCLTLGVWM